MFWLKSLQEYIYIYIYIYIGQKTTTKVQLPKKPAKQIHNALRSNLQQNTSTTQFLLAKKFTTKKIRNHIIKYFVWNNWLQAF